MTLGALGYVGYGVEVTEGTMVAPTIFLPATSFSFPDTNDFVVPQQIRSSRDPSVAMAAPFNISGSMFVNLEANPRIRASAQGLYMVMTNGLGAFLGTMLAGAVVDHYTTHGVRDWQSIWLTFAGYALVLGLVFPFVFRYRHDRAKMAAVAAH